MPIFRFLVVAAITALLTGCAASAYYPPEYQTDQAIDSLAEHQVCNNQYLNDRGYLVHGNCYNNP